MLATSKELKKRGHRVQVFTSDLYTETPFKHLDHPAQIVDGVPVRRFRTHTLGGEMHYVLMPGMTSAVLKEKPDVIHAHSYGYFQTHVASLARKLRGIPFIYSTHFHPEWSMWGGRRRKMLRRFYDKFLAQSVLDSADAVIAQTRLEAEDIARRLNLSKEKTKIIPPGVDISRFDNLPDERLFRKEFDVEDRIVLFVGRLATNKGLDVLIGAAPKVMIEYTDVKFVLAGDDQGMKAQLVEKAKWLGIEDKIIFTGHLDERFLLSAYAACDLFVLPSEYEAFGLVLLEAMACSKPCIGTKTGGVPEVIVHGKTGILVEYGNKDILAERICQLLLDDHKRRIMGMDGRRRVEEHFTWERVVDELERVYEAVLRG